MTKARGKASAGVDKACSLAIPPASPACPAGLPCLSNSDCLFPLFCDPVAMVCARHYPDGAAFVSLLDGEIVGNPSLGVGSAYCGSPSGAFVE